MRFNKYPELLKFVTTDYIAEDADVVRRITKIEQSEKHGSGYCASADAGEPCPCCYRLFSRTIADVDAAWFIPNVVNERKRK